jgi:OHCU decarboxylase
MRATRPPAHPELAGKAAVRGALTAESTHEQAGAGLNQCSPEEFAQLTALNAAYNAKFGFPFILAVKGHDRASILREFVRRIGNDRATEFEEALAQVARITRLRLDALIMG